MEKQNTSPIPEKLTPKQISIDRIEPDKKAKKPNLNYLREKDRKLVTGKFVNHETPGGVIDFCFRKYKGDKVERYKFEDGKVYRIPRGVALHIQNNCWYPVHEFRQDETGRPHQEIGFKKKRFSFMPLDFEVDDEFHKSEVQVYSVRQIS